MDARWIRTRASDIAEWLPSLRDPDVIGGYRPCARGLSAVGRRVALGPSCLALKLTRILGTWESVPPTERAGWAAFIRSFQGPDGGFDDPALQAARPPLRVRLRSALRAHPAVSESRAIRVAETKQALATLADVHELPARPFSAFPLEPDALRRHLLEDLNWGRPWRAGGQAAAMALFVALEAPRLLDASAADELRSACASALASLSDDATGAWFRGRAPAHGELVNGAMKLANAHEWLEVPLPKPEALIDTVLTGAPRSEGCHLVDALYVLYRCTRETTHRADDAARYALAAAAEIERHAREDGGFSYFAGRNIGQVHGIRYARSLAQSDLHGTLLLTWALALTAELVELSDTGLRVIRV